MGPDERLGKTPGGTVRPDDVQAVLTGECTGAIEYRRDRLQVIALFAAPGAECGFGAASKMVGRQRHVAEDTEGRLPMVNLAPPDASDKGGVQAGGIAARRRPRQRGR